VLASLLVLAAGANVIPDASAQQQPSAKALAEARTRYDKGKQLYSEGAFDAALAELQRSYELAPSYKILYNIALVQRARNDFAGALHAYEKYLADGGKEVAGSRRQEVQKELDTLKTLVARADIKTSVPDADVSVDDVPVGKSPLSGYVLNPGSHRITATKEGRQAAVKVIKVAGGDSVTVDLDMPESSAPQAGGTGAVVAPPAPTDTGTTAPPPADTGTSTGGGTGQPPPPPPPSRGPVWIGWAVTGALAIGAGVAGGLAMSKAGAHADLRKQPGVTADELAASRSDAKPLAIVTDVLIPCAVVAGAVSLYFSVRTVEPAKTGGTRLQIGASPTVGPSGVNGASGALLGTF
jgi:hypothetical protein